MMRILLLGLLVAACAPLPHRSDAAPPRQAPLVAHHQHLVSPATARLINLAEYDGAALLRQLDEAGIERGVVLSMGYTYADERKNVPNAEAQVRAENDWTANQVARSGGRLRGFCSVNPLTANAFAEVARCTRLPGMNGLKLHLGNSGISLRNPAHVARLRALFAQINRRRTPVVIHMRARGSTPYGAEDAQIFLDQVLPAIPDSVVQIAHLAGAGPGFPPFAQEAMTVFANAIAAHDRRTRNLWFDVTTVATESSTPEDGATIARLLRQAGLRRTLFGSDLPVGGNPPPAEAWRIFRARVPLTEAEFQTIMGNVAPYLARN